MSKSARTVWMAVAGLLLMGCVAYAATSVAQPLSDGTAVVLIPERDAVKLGPQPEPPDYPATGALHVPGRNVNKLSPQPEPPDYPTNVLRRLRDLFDFFSR